MMLRLVIALVISVSGSLLLAQENGEGTEARILRKLDGILQRLDALDVEVQRLQTRVQAMEIAHGAKLKADLPVFPNSVYWGAYSGIEQGMQLDALERSDIFPVQGVPKRVYFNPWRRRSDADVDSRSMEQ